MSDHEPGRTDGEAEWIRKWREEHDQDAANRLVEVHQRWVRQEVSRFCQGGHVQEDLMQEAWLAFFAAVEDYDPARGMSFKAYARLRVRWRLIELQARDLGVGEDGRRAWRLVQATWEQLAQKLGRLPGQEEVVAAAACRIVAHFAGWDYARAERAAREVLEAWGWKHLPIEEDWDDEGEEDERDGVSPRSSERGPEDVMLAHEPVWEWYRTVCEALGSEQGQKWMIVTILHGKGLENLNSEEIVRWLRELNSSADSVWKAIHAQYGLGGCVPGAWEDVQRLFAKPPPALNGDLQRSANNLRQWYCRANSQLMRCGILQGRGES